LQLFVGGAEILLSDRTKINWGPSFMIPVTRTDFKRSSHMTSNYTLRLGGGNGGKCFPFTNEGCSKQWNTATS